MSVYVSSQVAKRKLKLMAILQYKASLLSELAANEKPANKRRWWVRPWLTRRNLLGQYRTLFHELQEEDRESFFRFTRMTPEVFKELLKLVEPHMKKRSSTRREVISDRERLVLAVRYLATGDSQISQHFNFRIGRSTISGILREVCKAIWKGLKGVYMKPPTTKEEYLVIADKFQEEWDLPHVLGAIDGKHIGIDRPRGAGSDFYNHKGFHSTILMAACDAYYQFTNVSIGSYGRECDSTIFKNTQVFKDAESGAADIPGPSEVGGITLPYVFIGDEIFPLKPWLMKPYPGKSVNECERVYNYRLSRARRTIENAFGILAARWRIFRRPIRANVDLVDDIVMATTCMHNFLLQRDNARYTPQGFVDSYDAGKVVREGDWRAVVSNDASPCLQVLPPQGSRNYAKSAKDVREDFSKYVNTVGSVPWQLDYVRYCGHLPVRVPVSTIVSTPGSMEASVSMPVSTHSPSRSPSAMDQQ